MFELIDACKATSQKDEGFVFNFTTEKNGKVKNTAWAYRLSSGGTPVAVEDVSSSDEEEEGPKVLGSSFPEPLGDGVSKTSVKGVNVVSPPDENLKIGIVGKFTKGSSGNPWFVFTSKLKLKRVKLVLKGINSRVGNIHADVSAPSEALIAFQNSLSVSSSLDDLLTGK
ncbi:hypothetical protein AgCh_024366 [Apium graveolens]